MVLFISHPLHGSIYFPSATWFYLFPIRHMVPFISHPLHVSVIRLSCNYSLCPLSDWDVNMDSGEEWAVEAAYTAGM
jgi:hypothetical protein